MGESDSSPCSASVIAEPNTRRRLLSHLLILKGEPRRSGRANKGTNSDRWQEVLDSARQNFVNPDSVAGDTVTEAGTVVQEHANVELKDGATDEDRIRCVCGQTEEIEDEDKDFVQCDQCHVWQHSQCVGLPIDIPENQDYFCEVCRPDLHQELLTRLAAQAAKKSKKPKPRTGGKRKRTTKPTQNELERRTQGVALVGNTADDDELPLSPKRQRSVSLSDVSVVTEASEPNGNFSRGTFETAEQAPTKTSGRGRGSHGSASRTSVTQTASRLPEVQQEPGKQEARTTIMTGPYENVDDIKDVERKKIATALIKLVGDALNIAKDREGFVLPGDSTIEDKARSLGLHIEFAMFDAQLEAKSKFRQLSFNLKDPKNPSLRQRVFDGTLLPSELVQMSSEDMANPELKAKTEALREESLKQSVLVQETGPRLRRTHKGEEYVEGPDAFIEAPTANTGTYINRRTRDDTDSPMSVRSPSPSSSDESEEPDTPVEPKRERSTSNFDINNVWNHIESPADGKPASRSRQPSTPAIPLDGDDNDEDLLGLLNSGDRQSAPPKHDYQSQKFIWTGQLSMPGVSDLRAKASLIGGPKLFEVDWLEALTGCIQIGGRIPKPDAIKYLCHQKYSQSKSVFAIWLHADDGKEGSLKTLYDYFVKKDRFGVIRPGKTRIRDGYIVPLPADAILPEFITMLPSFDLPSTRTNMLLALLVVEKATPSRPSPVKAKPAVAPAAIAISAALPTPAAIPLKPQSPTKPPLEELYRHSPIIPGPGATPPLPPPQHHQSFQRLPPWQTPQQQYQSPPPPQMMPYQQQYGMEDPYARHAGHGHSHSHVGRMDAPTSHSPMPPQLDQNAQAILGAFLRAHPEIAANTQVISSPQLMATLLEEFVRNGGMRQ